jgi:sec-independent protein translocase protein TatA
MGNLGVSELLVILLIVLVFFGSKKIPELAQGLGKGIREFKKATQDIDDDISKSSKEEPKKIDQSSSEK